MVLALSSSRPMGVTILAILEALAGLYYLITGVGDFIAAAVIRSLMLAGMPSEIVPMLPRVVGSMLIIFGLLSLLLAWGLWVGKGWARMTALVFAIVAIILSILSFHLIGIIIDALIIYYLTRPNVKQFFTK